jgi:hypothetical protein
MLGLSPSIGSARGTNVTYTDVAEGYDMQLIYSPLRNWQFIFAYAHTERKVKGSFKLLPVIDPESGLVFGTEYDIWVRTFGREAFGLEETDTDGDGVVDQVTKNGQPIVMGDVSPTDLTGGLEGVSLYTGSKVAASLWTKYQFIEGPFKGLDVGFGVIYTGPAPTSIPIGGSALAENRFRTPDTKERYRINSALRYSFNALDNYWTLSLNVYNILNNQKGMTIANYRDNGMPLMRRTEVFYAPRSYRLAMSVDF